MTLFGRGAALRAFHPPRRHCHEFSIHGVCTRYFAQPHCLSNAQPHCLSNATQHNGAQKRSAVLHAHTTHHSCMQHQPLCREAPMCLCLQAAALSMQPRPMLSNMLPDPLPRHVCIPSECAQQHPRRALPLGTGRPMRSAAQPAYEAQ